MTTPPLLAIEGLAKHYALPRQRLFAAPPRVDALRGVTLSMQSGTSLGLVGESGSGKSTLARLVMALERPSAGRVSLLGRDLHALAPAALRHARRDFQMVFQDPYGSLDPRQRVGRIVAEPLDALDAGGAADRADRADRAERVDRVAAALDAVGLRPSDVAKYPHEFSGGQRQRIAIARALITRPRLIVADEPVSALDVSVQAQVLNLLLDLQQQFGVTYLFISHDLAVVDHVCGEVAVMFAGRIVEQGPPDVLFGAAAHPYTQALLAAMPMANRDQPGPRRRAAVASAVSSAVGDRTASEQAAAPAGCAYAPRCPFAQPRCAVDDPPLRTVDDDRHAAACHFAPAVRAGVAPARTLP